MEIHSIHIDDTKIKVQHAGGNLYVHSHHRMLHDIGAQLLRNFGEHSYSQPINLSIGLGTDIFYAKDGINIGIQMEQLKDLYGQPMWRKANLKLLKNHVSNYDQILELSRHHQSVYEEQGIDIEEKVTFGPYIFPTHPRNFQPNHNNKLVFYGNRNDRRILILETISEIADIEILPKTWGQATIKNSQNLWPFSISIL